MPKVSIIIPVYNAEPYLRKCLDSAVCQTLADIEIIIVNDESPDHSDTIIAEYEARDRRVKVVNRKNGGLARARNSGLEVATGDYIGFLDCDDWIEPDMFERMYEAAKGHCADIAICNYNMIFADRVERSRLELQTQVLDMDLLGMRRYFDQYYFTYKHGDEVWNKIYRRQYLLDFDILFEPETFSEDKLFNLTCLLNVKKISTVGVSFYNYLQREGSLMYRAKPDYTKRQLTMMNRFYKKAQSCNKERDIETIFHDLVLHLLENVVYGKLVVEKMGMEKVLQDLKAADGFDFFKPSMRSLMRASHSLKIRVYSFLLYYDFWRVFLLLKKFMIKTRHAAPSALHSLNIKTAA